MRSGGREVGLRGGKWEVELRGERWEVGNGNLEMGSGKWKARKQGIGLSGKVKGEGRIL